jgi:hypothetical protein
MGTMTLSCPSGSPAAVARAAGAVRMSRRQNSERWTLLSGLFVAELLGSTMDSPTGIDRFIGEILELHPHRTKPTIAWTRTNPNQRSI